MLYPNARSWNLIAAQLLICLLLSVAPASHAQSNRDKAARFYEDALQRYERKDVAGAIIQLKNALQIDKTMLPVQVLLGRALLANGEAAAAEVALGEALRLGVNRAEVVVPYALALVAQGKQGQMLETPSLQVGSLPAAVQLELLLVRASAFSDVGDMRAALRSIDEARALNPTSVDTWLAEVPIRIRSRQYAEARVAADRALQLAPKNAEAHYQKGALLHVLAQSQSALALYEQALALDIGHIEARLARAGILLDLGRDKDARADIEILQSQAPLEPRAFYLRALLAERSGDVNASKAALKEVTELLDAVPIEFIRFRPQFLMLAGMAHYGLNQFAKAKPYLEYALRQQPNSPLAKLLAQIYIAEPNIGRAEELLESYLKTRPGDGQAMVMLASLQMNQGRHSKATSLMQEALRARDLPEFRTALGLSLMRGGQTSMAVSELERAYKSDGKQTYAGLALVNLYLRQGQFAKAQTVADGLVKSNPTSPTALLVQGLARLRANDLSGARTSYEKALKLDANLVDGALGLARVDIASKSFDAAEKRLRDILKTSERNVDALFEMAVMHEMAGRDGEALKWLEAAAEASSQRETRANSALVAWHLRKGSPAKALDSAKLLLAKLPEDVDALQAYASAQLATGDLPGARSTLANASRRAAYEAPTLVQVAQAQLNAKDLAGSAYSLEKALSAKPDFLPAMVLMTGVELQQGDSAKAERRARRIIQLQPKLPIGHTLLADVALSRKQLPAAIESLRRAHELAGTSATLLRLFGALSMQDDGKGAISLAESWMKSQPKDLTVQRVLADAYVRVGNFAAAKRGYEAVLRLKPDDVTALNNLANVLMQQNAPEALNVAEKALARDPRNPLLIDTAGWANHLAGNKDRALQLLRDARLREPNSPDIRYHLAAALAKAGRNAEAKAELEAALKGGTSFESAKEARKLLDTLK